MKLNWIFWWKCVTTEPNVSFFPSFTSTLTSTMCVCTISFQFPNIFRTLHLIFYTWWPLNFTIIQSQSMCFRFVVTIECEFMHNFYHLLLLFTLYALAFAEHTPNFFSTTTLLLLFHFLLFIFPRILTFGFLFCEVFHFVRFFLPWWRCGKRRNQRQ